MDDTELKSDLLSFVTKNWRKKEILDLRKAKYSAYAWSERTRTRRLQYFDIKFTDYDVDVEEIKTAVREEIEGAGQLLGYQSMQQKIREIHGLHVPRDLVYAAMSDVAPEGLEARGGVGQPKRRRRTNVFVAGVSKSST